MKNLAILLILSISFLFISCDEDTKKDEKDIKTYELTTENIANTCNAEIACGIFDTPDTVNDCVMYTLDLLSLDKDSTFGKQYYDYVLKIEDYIECVYNSNDCTVAAACIDVVLTEENCDYKTYEGSCSGNIKSSCNRYGKVIKEDCAFGNQTCVNEDGDVYCDDKKGSECDDDTYKSTCDSGVITFCQNGKILSMHCDTISGEGSICTTDTDGAFCEGAGDECDYYDYTESCDGDLKVVCGVYDTVSKIDCKKLWGADYTCTMMDSEYGKYATCMYQDVLGSCNNEPTCNGDILNYCVNGENKTFDCTEFGYNSCLEKTADNPASCGL